MADGLGPSLELIDPHSNPDPSVGANWMASFQSGGTPGRAPTAVPTNPNEDRDTDGFNAVAEYYFGTSDNFVDPNPATIQPVVGGMTFSFPRDPAATGASHIIELSEDLDNWADDPESYTLQPDSARGDGRIEESLILDTDTTKRFIRVRVIAN